jgi:polyprenyl-phospho-N-acetylgalactosaminyl synthase
MKVFIVMAAYNEETKIAKVIDSLKKNYNNIVVVDDGSEDKTFEISNSKKVFVLKHFLNRGQGAALKTGIDFSLREGAEIIVTFDADGQFLAKDIKKIIEPIIKKEADVVLGSRFLGEAINIPFLKKLVLKLGILVVYFLYGVKITDSQCGFRALSRKAALSINLTSDRMEHASEFFWEIRKNKLKYKEVPITVIYDDYSLKKGQSWKESLKLGIKMLLKRFFL